MKIFQSDLKSFLKSPNLLSNGIRVFLLVTFPLVAYFQDFVQLFYLALVDPEIQYVLLVPFIVAFFFYRRRNAFLVSRKASWPDYLLGFSLCSLALIIYIWGSYSFYILPLHLISLPIFVAGIIQLVFGPATLQLLVFPTSLLVFLSPFPLVFLDVYGGSLVTTAASLSASILKLFLPIKLSFYPVVTLSTCTVTGQNVSFEIAAACSGMYFVTAMAFFAVVFLHAASGPLAKKGVFAVFSLLTAYGLNVLRIVLTVGLGHFFGYGLAVNFFHLFGGLALLFIGTLILLFTSDRVLKLPILQEKQAANCPYCSKYEDTCLRCGRILKLPKNHLDWKHMVLVLFFLMIVTVLVSQASGIAYNKVLSNPNSSITLDTSTGNTTVFPTAGNWSTTFMGRETQAENTLGLYYVGDYILNTGNTSNPVTAILELSDAQSKFHTWEGCLNYQAYEINIQETLYSTIYDQNNVIVNAETIIANEPEYKQNIIVTYWFDALNFNINGTTRVYAVKLSLLNYIYYGANQSNAADIEAASTQLSAIAMRIEQYWSPYKIPTTSFVVDIYRNKEASTFFVAGMLIFSLSALGIQSLLKNLQAKKKIKGLPEEDQHLLKTFSPEIDSRAEKENKEIPDKSRFEGMIQRLRQQGLLQEQITMKNGQLYNKCKNHGKNKSLTH